MTLLTVSGVQAGRPVCILGSTRQLAAPSPCRSHVGGLGHSWSCLRPGLLPSLPGRKVGVRVLAGAQKRSEAEKGGPSLLASLPQWCHRLTGAFVLVPFLVFGGSKHAVAQPLNQPKMDAYPAATVRPNPLFETSTMDLSNSTQFRAAAALATAMVGYGFVRSSNGSAVLGGRQTRGSVVAGATTTSYLEAPPETEEEVVIPESADDRKRQLDRLYDQIEELKGRNTEVWKAIKSIMESAAAAESTTAQQDAAVAAATAALERAAAGAASSATSTAAGVPSVTLSVDDVASSAAASVAAANRLAAAEATSALASSPPSVSSTAVAEPATSIPMRPSGGASRLSSVSSLSSVDDASLLFGRIAPSVPTPERAGGASSRSGPWTADAAAEAAAPLTPRSPPDSSRVRSPESSPQSSPAGSPGSPEATLLPPSPAGSPPASPRSPAGSPPDSSRVPPQDEEPAAASGTTRGSPSLWDPVLAAWAGEAVEQAASRSPSTSPSSSPASTPTKSRSPSRSPGGSPSVGELISQFSAYSNPVADAAVAPPPPLPPSPAREPAPPAEVMRPSVRPTRRVTAARQPRTYRAIPSTPTRSHPSFDVPEDALPPSEYLPKEIDGRTSEGRFNPSFAPATPAGSPSAAAAPAPVAAPFIPEVEEEDEEPLAPLRPAAPPEAAAAAPAVAEPTVPPVAAPLAEAVSTPLSPSSPLASAAAAPLPVEPERVWYNPLSWFTQRSDAAAEVTMRTNPSFDASFAVADASSTTTTAFVDSVTAAAPEAAPAVEAAAVFPLAPEAAAPQPEMLAVVAEEAVEEQLEKEEEAPVSKLESLVRVAEEQDADGVGAAAAESAAVWSEALTEGAKPGDFGPVERVAELLEVAMQTEEFADPKYDPIRDALQPGASGPTAVHKFDLLRGLERVGKEEVEVEAVEEAVTPPAPVLPTEPAPAEAAVVAEAAAAEAPVVAVEEGKSQQQDQEQDQAASRPVYKYDLVYDLLQSVRTSGDPAAILASSDPKYDPVWSLLNMRAPTRGSMSKYDLVSALLEAALAASPQPSRYDPLQALLQVRPITDRSKYCLAEVLVRGGWQQPLESGLEDLPSWDPMSALVGGKARRRAAEAVAQRRAAATAATGRRRVVSKYDMIGQALEAAASLPEDLASGKWAASQPRDPFLKPRGRTEAPRIRRPRSKYDMVGQALEAAASLPEELSSGKWAASQGRELLLDTANRTLNEGGWGFVRRIRNGGAAAFKAVSAAASAGGNLLAKAAGLPYEIAPGVFYKVEKPRGASPGRSGSPIGAATEEVVGLEIPEEELPTLVFQFKKAFTEGLSGSPKGKKRDGPVTVTAKSRKGRGMAPPGRSVAPEVPPAPEAAPEAAVVPRLARAVIPPSRQTGRRVTKAQQAALAAAAVPVPAALPYVDSDALVAALVDSRLAVQVSQDEVLVPLTGRDPWAAPSADDAPVPLPLGRSPWDPPAPVPAPAVVEPEVAAAPVAAAVVMGVEVPVAAAEAAPEAASDAAPASEDVAVSEEASLVAEETEVEAAAPAELAVAVAADATAEAVADDSSATAVSAEAEAPAAAAATSAEAPEATMAPAEMAVDLLVIMSIQSPRGSAKPSLDSLLARFGPGFGAVASQLRSLRHDTALVGRYPAINRLVRAASESRGDGAGMWSYLYDMTGAVQDGEAVLPGFLEDVAVPYPQLHALLATGDKAQGISVLCSLCNLIPDAPAGDA